jgi:predicted TIM-barrel fold metal-dependent hydrolase
MTGLVNAHFHIWRQADLPGLLGPMQPRIFGPYEPIRRDYPIEKLWTTYASLVEAHRAGVPATDYDQVFNRTARRVYRLGQ